MISEEKAMNELDSATSHLSMIHEIELYSLLMRIKHTENREIVLDEAIKLSQFKLENVWKIDKKSLDCMDNCFK